MARTLRPESIFPITTRRLEVRRVADVTPAMRRVTLSGEGLRAHTAPGGHAVAAFRSEGFDDEFKLILPDPETGDFRAPTQADGVLNWPGDSFSATRTYTVRRWDAEAGEIDVDVVKHGSGPATTWAYSCAPGDALHIAGPKMSYGHPDVEWLLIAGDETALPAIGRLLEQLPAGQKASVFIEVAEPAHIQRLDTVGDVDITWLSRDGRPAGTTTLLQDAMANADWVSDDVYAWVAGEALTLTPIRRWLRNEKGLPRERVEVAGYWRRTGAEAEGADEIEAPDESTADTLHELLEIAPAVAIRVAVTLGVIRRLGLEPQTSTDLAAAAEVDAEALDRLLRYLAALDIIARAEGDGVWTLRPLGSELDDDRYTEVLSLDTATGRTAVGIVGLLDAVRTGRSGHAATFGRTFADLVDGDAALSRSRLHSELAEWTATPLAASTLLDGLADIRVAGPGSGDIARALLAQHPDARVRVLVPPSQAEAARDLFAAELSATEDGEGAGSARVEVETGGLLDRRPVLSGAYLLVGALAEFGDADAAHVLAEAAASTQTGEVLVLEDPFSPEAGDEHELEHDLELLAVHGGALRTDDDLDALSRAAGLVAAGRETVGWGRVLRRYRRA